MSSARADRRVFLAGGLAALLAPRAARAQSGRARVSGWVGRNSVNALTGARIELTPLWQARGRPLVAVTDAQGHYAVRDVPLGEYTVRVSAPGFITQQITVFCPSDSVTQVHFMLRPVAPDAGPAR